MTYKLEHDINIRNDRLESALNVFEKQMKTSKPKLLDKNKITIEKHTFDSMNNVISETKKIMEIQPKLEKVFSEVNNFTNSYKSLEKQNQKYKKEINSLEARCDNLERENRSLKYRLEYLFESIKKFFRKLLQRGNEKTKDDTAEIVKDYYDSDEFDMQDVVGISRGTTKQDELFEYVEAPDYLKSRVKDYDEYEKDKDDFEIGF
jgi:chromosome segregation ATPase